MTATSFGGWAQEISAEVGDLIGDVEAHLEPRIPSGGDSFQESVDSAARA